MSDVNPTNTNTTTPAPGSVAAAASIDKSCIQIGDVRTDDNGGIIENLEFGMEELHCEDAFTTPKILTHWEVKGYYQDKSEVEREEFASQVCAPAYTRIRSQIRAYGNKWVEGQMVIFANAHQLRGERIFTNFGSLVDWWRNLEKASPDDANRMEDVCLNDWTSLGEWTQTVEKTFLAQYNWRYSDPSHVNRTIHMEKVGMGSARKSSVEMIFTRCKGQAMKKINSKKNRHTWKIKTKRDEDAIPRKDGKVQRKKKNESALTMRKR